MIILKTHQLMMTIPKYIEIRIKHKKKRDVFPLFLDCSFCSNEYFPLPHPLLSLIWPGKISPYLDNNPSPPFFLFAESGIQMRN